VIYVEWIVIIALSCYLFATSFKRKDHNKSTISEHQLMAQKYVDNGKFEEAEKEIFNDLKRNNPDDLVLDYYALGVIYYRQKKIKKALSFLKQAWAADRDNYDATFCISRIYYELYEKFSIPADLEKAVEFIEKTLEIKPNHKNSLLRMGSIYFNKGNIEKAMKYYQRIIDANPQNANAYYSLGSCNLEQGNYEKAIGFYKQAIESSCDKPQYCQYWIGYCHEHLKDLNEAESWYRKSLKSGYGNAQEKLNEIKARKTAGY